MDDLREATLNEIRDSWYKEENTFGRVYTAILSITEYTHYPDVAEIADCSANTAKKYLERLVEIGVVQRDPKVKLARYRRNDAYLEWREVTQIAEDLSVSQTIERVEELETQRKEFEEEFGSSDPTTVSVFDAETEDEIHDRMKTVSEWQSIERRIHLYELARQISQNDGHLLPPEIR